MCFKNKNNFKDLFNWHDILRGLNKNMKGYDHDNFISYNVFNVLDKLSDNIMLFYLIFNVIQIMLGYDINYM